MALNDIIVPRENAQGTFDEIALPDATTSARGLLSSSDKTKLDGIASGAEVNVNADWTASSGDAQILNKPSSFTPTAHAASHATGGSDPLAPSDIGAMPQFAATDQTLTAASTTLTAGRARRLTLATVHSGTTEVVLPTTSNQNADLFQLIRGSTGVNQTINVTTSAGGSTVASLGGTADAGRSFTFRYQVGPNSWFIVPVDAHSADKITSGTLTHERGGLEADVSAYSGLLKISGGATSAVTVTTAGEALLDDADAAAQRTTLGLGTAATAATGDFAAASHSHELTALAATGATNGHILTANGSNGVTFAALPASGISNVDSTLADVMSVSGSNLVADDGGLVDSSNPVLTWDDAAGKAVWANPLRRTSSGAFYVGLAPTTTALGSNAVNIQPARGLGTARLASGLNTIAIGESAHSSAEGANSIGYRATSSAFYATSLGQECTASGEDSVAIGGYLASATANNAVAIGRQTTANLRAMFSTRAFNAVYWGGQTTTNAATILNLDATATNRFTIAANTALAVDILLVARRSDTADKWLVARRFLGIRRDGSNNTSLIGSVQTLGTDQSAGSPTWTFTLTADDTNEALQLEVTGAASETVQWRATAFYRFV